LSQILKDTGLVTEEKFKSTSEYNYRTEYLEMSVKYLALVYDFIFFSCRVSVIIWDYFNVVINEWGWCASEENYLYTEFIVAVFFLITWLLLQKIVFLPLRLYGTFVIEQ